jgi:hypothetical protein
MKPICLSVLLLLGCGIPMSARCKGGAKEIRISAGTPPAGDTVAGPCTIIVRGLNPARYDYSFNSTVTFGAAPDLWSKLLPLSTGDNAKSTPAPSPTPAGDHKTADSATTSSFFAFLSAPKRGGHAALATKTSDRLTQLANAAVAATDAADEILAQGRSRIEAITAPDAPLNRQVQRYNAYQGLRRQASAATAAVSNGGRALNVFLQQSDSDIATGGYPLLRQDISSLLTEAAIPPAPNDSPFIAGIKAQWPAQDAISAIRTQIDTDSPALAASLQDLTSFKANQEQALTARRDSLIALREEIKKEIVNLSNVADRETLTNFIDRITLHVSLIEEQKSLLINVLADLTAAVKRDTDISAGVADVDASGKPYADFRAAQDALAVWKNRLSGVREAATLPDPFAMPFRATCDFAFSRTKTTVVQLKVVDKTPGTTSNPTTITLITVECTSPFSVSVGVAFSTIGEREFAIQPAPVSPGSTTTQNTFVEITDSATHPLPLAMIHVRLHETGNKLSWHGSFGLAGNIRGQGSGGSNAEFLMGPSLGLFRAVFLTPGLYIGQKVSLGAGFQTNGPVPPSITQPPLQKSYKPAFGFAITFAKP